MSQQLFESVRETYKKCCDAGKPDAVAALVAEQVGYADADGRLYGKPGGPPKIDRSKARLSASDVNPEAITQAILGENWRGELRRGRGVTKSRNLSQMLSEESAAPITPGALANVGAWSATMGVLIGASFADGYDNIEYDLADLFPTRPYNAASGEYWQGGNRIIDIFGPSQPAQIVGPGEEHPDVSLSALYVETGPMRKYGGKILLTRETVAMDVSGGQFLAKAKLAGDTLKYRLNELVLDVICGQFNNFRLGLLTDPAATGYNTYGPTIGGRLVPNDNVNPLNDVGALTNSDAYAVRMFNPATGLPMRANLPVVLLPQSMATWAAFFNGVNQITLSNQSTSGLVQAPPGGGTFPNVSMTGPNPWSGVLKPRLSQWLDVRHAASTVQADPNLSAGLGLTGAGLNRWYRIDPAKFAFIRMGWEQMNIDLNPNDYQMAVQGIIAGQVFDMAAMVQVVNPYYVQRNRGL